MKKLSMIFISIILIFGLIGCENKEAKLSKEIDDLKLQADEYYNNGDLNNTITLYEKILYLRENQEDRNYLDELIIEKESMAVTLSFIESINDFKNNYNTIHNLTDLSEFIIKIKPSFDELEKIDTSKNTEISLFVNSLLKDLNYVYLRGLYDKDFIKDAEYNADLSKTLDLALGGYDARLADDILFDSIQINLENSLENIPTELPSKYGH